MCHPLDILYFLALILIPVKKKENYNSHANILQNGVGTLVSDTMFILCFFLDVIT